MSVVRRHLPLAVLVVGLIGSTRLAATELSAQDVRTRELLRIGVLEGDRQQEFGLIKGVAVDSVGGVFVLDSRLHVVRAFDRSGSFVAEFGRPGAGPDEFSHLFGLRLLGDGRVLVLDAGNARLTELRFDGSAFKRMRTMRLPLSTQDFCVLGERIFLLGYHDGHVIHEVTSDGRWVRSFGVPPQAPSEFASDILTGGVLRCIEHPRGDMIVHMSLLVPSLVAYSVDSGRAAWSATLDGFAMVDVESERGRVTLRAPRGFHHATVSAVPLTNHPNALLLVQFGKQGGGNASNPEEVVDVETRIFSLETGRELSRSMDLPRIDHVQNSTAYSVLNVPFPHVVISSLQLH